MTRIKMSLLPLYAVLLLALAVCSPAHSQALSKGTVVWGISGIVDNPDGALILDVSPDGAAAKAGLAPGDIIMAVDGSPVKTSKDLKGKIKASRPYTPVTVIFQRAGKRLEKALLPRGFLRLEIKDFDRSFVIPGVPQVPVKPQSSALDKLENINVLKEVIIDRASGQIAIVGSYNPKYATGPLPYLDLLKTALKYPEPVLQLIEDEATEQAVERYSNKNFYGVESLVSVLLAMPAAERERQQLIRHMAAAYGITPEEYAAVYNYTYLDIGKELAPPEINRILVKIFRHLGRDDVAAAYEKLSGRTSEAFAQALKILGKEAEAQRILDDKSRNAQQMEDYLLTLACITMMEKLGYAPEAAQHMAQSVRTASISPAQVFDAFYKFITLNIKDKSGLSLCEASVAKVPIGDAPTRIICGADSSPLFVRIQTEGLDRTTQLARILYEADYAGKTFLVRPDLFESVPGQTTYSEYLTGKLKELGGVTAELTVDAKFWFEPKRVDLSVSPNKKVVSFGPAEIRFTTIMDELKGVKPQQLEKLTALYKDWCTQYTDKYELYAQALPAFHSLRESAKVIALARWLNSEKIVVNLDSVRQEQWEPPEKITGYWRGGVLYAESAPGKFTYPIYSGVTGGVTFKPKQAWTAVESTPKGETNLSEQLKLSSQLGEKAVEAAHGGNIENARYLSELSAQALTGEISRGDLIKLNVPLADPVELPASSQAVLLQKEMIKQTYNEIGELSKSPASREKAVARLGQIGIMYSEIRANPPAASEYLQKLQTGQLSGSPASMQVVRPVGVPAPSTDDEKAILQLHRELLGSLSDTIRKRTSLTSPAAQEILKYLKTKKPPELESFDKNINDLAPGDVVLIAPVPLADWNKAGMKDVLISNAVNLLDRWGSNCWSSPASHVAVFIGERNGKRWYMDNTSEHGPVIKEERPFLKEYGQREMNVATLVGEPISKAEGEAIFKATHVLRDAGITYGVGSDKRMVCSDAARWLIMQAGRNIPRTESGPGYPNLITAFVQKKDVVSCSPADFYENREYFVIRPLDIKRK